MMRRFSATVEVALDACPRLDGDGRSVGQDEKIGPPQRVTLSESADAGEDCVRSQSAGERGDADRLAINHGKAGVPEKTTTFACKGATERIVKRKARQKGRIAMSSETAG